MVQNLPSLLRPAPDTGSASYSSLTLHQRIAQQVRVTRQLRAMKPAGFPGVIVRLRISPDERIDHILRLERLPDAPVSQKVAWSCSRSRAALFQIRADERQARAARVLRAAPQVSDQ